MQIHNTFRLYHCLHLSEVFISETKIRSIRLRRKPDLRGRKDANDMIIKNTHKIISYVIFIIDDKTISDIIRNQEHTNHTWYDFYLSEHYQMKRAGWIRK